MTPPVRRRSLEEIFGGRAPEPEAQRAQSRLGGLGPALAQGVLAGVANPIMAAAGTAVRKLQGDDRSLADIYGQLKGDVDTQEREFARAYPGTNLAANVAGGLASAATGGVGAALNRITPLSGLSALGRAGNAAVQGAVAGGVAGAVNADAPEDMLSRAARGAAMGGVAGGGFSLFADGLRQAARAAGLGPQAANGGGVVSRAVGRVRDAIGAETAEESGARRVLRLADQTGRSLDDLRATEGAAAADDPTILAERFGPKGAQRLRTIRTVGNRAREQVDETLFDRASDETTRLRTRLSELTGVEQRDPTDVANAALAKIAPDAELRYKVAEGVPLSPEATRAVAEIIQPLDADGLNISGLARKLGGMPALPRPGASGGSAWETAQSAVEGLRRSVQEASEAAATLDAYDGLVTQVDADALRTRSPNLTAAQRRARTMGKKRATDEVLSRGEKRELRYDLTEDARARIEEAGFSVQDYTDMVQRGREAQRRLPGLQERLAAAESALEQAAIQSDAEALPSMTLGQVLNYRQVLDAVIEDNAATSYGRKVNARLMQAREALDEIAKSGGGDREGAQAVQEADQLFREAKQAGESFAGGVRAAQSGAGPTAQRIVREQPNPEMARQGVANDLLRRLAQVGDENTVQNPANRVLRSRSQREIGRMAFPDEAGFRQFRDEAQGVTRRLGTLRTATGGSQTSDNVADVLAEFVDPTTVAAAMSGGPGGLMAGAQKLLQSGLVRRLVDANAAEADAMAPYLLAGGPEQMSRREALAILERMQPFVQARLGRQQTGAALAGAGAARAVLPPSRSRRDR